MSVHATATSASGTATTSAAGASSQSTSGTPAPTATSASTSSALAWTGDGIAEPRFLSPTSVWNTPLSANAPLDPSSSVLSAAVANMAATYGAGLGVTEYSTPIYIVPADQPTVYMHLDPNTTTGKVNSLLQSVFTAVPVPADAQPAAGTDELMVIYQPSTDMMWETWHTQLESDGWHFGYGGRILNASQNPGYYQQILSSSGTPLEEPFWGPTGSGLTLADSVISFRDLADGYIDHALALDLPHQWIRAGVAAWPADRSDGVSTAVNSVPEGAHFRLNPNININSLNLPPLTRMIALAAQQYGFIVRDGSSNITIDGQAPRTPQQTAAWQQALNGSGFQYWSQVLRSFPWQDLQLMPMSLSLVN